MPYMPLSYEELHRATAEVEQIFNDFSRRYCPPTYELLRERCSEMERTYRQHVGKKGNLFWALSPDLVRLEEITCITRLIESLPKTIPPASPERNSAQNIILGALFYRRLSIKASYEDALGGKVLSYAPSFVRGLFSREHASALYQTIEDVLELNAEKTLDDLSVATCCRAYLLYLRERGATRKSAYIRDEPDFFEKLEAMMVRAEAGSRRDAEQVQHLTAIQSIAAMLRKTDAEVCAGLSSFSATLSTKLNSQASFTRQDMIACISTTSLSLRTQSFIGELLPDDLIVNKDNWELFVATMKPRLVRHSQYILLGAYVLVLKEPHAITPNLSLTLNMAIGALRPGNALDDDVRKWALIALTNYLELPDMRRDFDFRAWHGYDALLHQVTRQGRGLQRLVDMAKPISSSMIL